MMGERGGRRTGGGDNPPILLLAAAANPSSACTFLKKAAPMARYNPTLASYAMCSTEIGYRAMIITWSYAKRSSGIGYRAMQCA
eukprot:3548006-Rhodomonas_salina.1